MPKLTTDFSAGRRSVESHWDWFFFAALAGLLLFLPFSMGAVEAWSEMVVSALAAALVVGLILRVWLEPSFRLVRTWAYLPLVAIIGLIVLQLVPLPRTMIGLLSDNSIKLRESLGVGESAATEGSFVAITLYPFETTHDLRMALIFIAVFVTVANVFQTKEQIKLALWGVFVLGCLEATVAVVQILTLTQRVHWTAAERGSVVTSGSFVNHSHFCQFMNLALGAGLAIVLVCMKEDSRRDRGQISRLVDLRGERYLRPLTGIVLCVTVVFTSMSRNGVLSLLIAVGIIAVALYRRGVLSTRGWLLAIVPWTVVILVFFTSFDKIFNRFAALEEQGDLAGRLELTTGTLRAWRDFPAMGTGLGTHEYVFPLYDTATSRSMAEHADNDWAQLFEEFGLLGATAVICFVLSILGVAAKLMLTGKTTLSTAAFGLSLGLLAAAWHSLSDFGQRLPGVFVLTAVNSGLLVCVARYERRKTRSHESRVERKHVARRRSTAFAVTVSILAVATCCWGLSGAFWYYQSESWSNMAFGMEQRLESNSWLGADQDYVDLLTAAERAAELEPTNVKRGYMLNLYRWRSISRERDSDTGDILVDDNSVQFVSRLVQELAALRTICPIYGPIHGLEGELRTFVLGDGAGKELINHAARLTPFHAPTNLVAGQLAAMEGRWEEAKPYLRRTVTLDPGQFDTVARLCVSDFRPQQLEFAEALAEDKYGRLELLAKILDDADPPQSEDAERLRNRAVVKLRKLVASGRATAAQFVALAQIELNNSNADAGIDLLRQAVGQDYGRVSWRMLLARTLLEVGEPEEALRQANIVLRLKPRSKAATELIDQIRAKQRNN